MFTPQTEAALEQNMQIERGVAWTATLPAEVYRELVICARCWKAISEGRIAIGAPFSLVKKSDGSVRVEPL